MSDNLKRDAKEVADFLHSIGFDGHADRVRTLSTDNKTLTAENKRRQTRITALVSEVNDSNTRLGELITNVSTLTAENERLGEENRKMKNANLAAVLEVAKHRNAAEETGNELEQARTQLAGCLTAAEGVGVDSAAVQGDYGWSLPYQKTLELRQKCEDEGAAVTMLEWQQREAESHITLLDGELAEKVCRIGELEGENEEFAELLRAALRKDDLSIARIDVLEGTLIVTSGTHQDALARIAALERDEDSKRLDWIANSEGRKPLIQDEAGWHRWVEDRDDVDDIGEFDGPYPTARAAIDAARPTPTEPTEVPDASMTLCAACGCLQHNACTGDGCSCRCQDSETSEGEAFECPQCGSHHFGTDSRTDEWVVHCHGDGCQWFGSHSEHVNFDGAPTEAESGEG